jgi:hypothetical protein
MDEATMNEVFEKVEEERSASTRTSAPMPG